MVNSRITDAIDAAHYTLRVEETTAIVPCVSLVLCLDRMDPTGVQEFHDRGLEALGGAVTHYRAEQMKRRAPITARTRKMLQTWLARASSTTCSTTAATTNTASPAPGCRST